MSYEVRITRKAFRDMQEAADYIEFEKYNPDAADNLLDIAAEMIKNQYRGILRALAITGKCLFLRGNTLVTGTVNPAISPAISSREQ